MLGQWSSEESTSEIGTEYTHSRDIQRNKCGTMKLKSYPSNLKSNTVSIHSIWCWRHYLSIIVNSSDNAPHREHEVESKHWTRNTHENARAVTSANHHIPGTLVSINLTWNYSLWQIRITPWCNQEIVSFHGETQTWRGQRGKQSMTHMSEWSTGRHFWQSS